MRYNLLFYMSKMTMVSLLSPVLFQATWAIEHKKMTDRTKQNTGTHTNTEKKEKKKSK